MIKKILLALGLLSALLSSPAIADHSYHHGYFKNFWRDFDHQFQNFDRQMDWLRHPHIVNTQSRQYFNTDTNHYVIEIKISALDKQDLDIELKNNTLIIQGAQESEKTNDNQSSRSYNHFYQVISLPKNADIDNIEAKFENSILTIDIPKLDNQKSNSQKIKIQ